MYFDGEIPDYRLIGKLNPDKTPETPDLKKKLQLKSRILVKLNCN